MNLIKYFIAVTFSLFCLNVNAQSIPSNTVVKSSKEAPEEAKASLNQAFSYISSAKAAGSKKAQQDLLLNAEKELNNSIKIYPNYAEALMNRGVLYMTMSKLNKAELDLKAAQALEPKNPNIGYNIVCLYSITNRVDLAIDLLDEILKLGFDNYDSLRSDPDLKALRKSKEFQKVLEKNKVFLK